MQTKCLLIALVAVMISPTVAYADPTCNNDLPTTIDCTFTGTEDGFVLDIVFEDLRPIVTIDPAGNPCYVLTAQPAEPIPAEFVGLPAAPPLDQLEQFVYDNYPHCPPALSVEESAWEVFARLELELPEPTLAPEAAGITGLATYMTDAVETPVTWSGVLPNGIPAIVEANLEVALVDWGDGSVEAFNPEALDPSQEGAVQHTYTTKTCDAEYRDSHPRGHLCHPTFEAYPLTVVFTWSGRYDAGAGWVEIGVRELVTTVPYDVDEAIGVPVER